MATTFLSGGQQTTVNSTITELFPALCFNNNYNYSNKCCDLMTPNEIPDLCSFLTANGYQIETQLTNMLLQNDVSVTSGKRIVCSATYYGNKQPSIVYMK